MRVRILLATLALVAAVAISAFLLRGFWNGSPPAASSNGKPHASAGSGQHDYRGYTSLSEMVASSSVVAQVRIIKQLRSYHLALDPPVTNNAPMPPLNGNGATKVARVTPRPITTSPPASPEVGPPQVDYLVRVVTSVKGAPPAGAQLVVTQDGGPPVPQIGGEEVVFLRPNLLYPASKYVLTGGPQGRFVVNSNKTVASMAPAAPVGRLYDHASVQSLLS
ncbi:MAG: hypothetical protein ACRDFX_07410, partial [Chloroflexota bacterium]